MNDDRVGINGPGKLGQSAADDALAADLRALRADGARDLPTLDDTARAISAARSHKTHGGFLMAKIQDWKSRPMQLALACGAALALVLVFVPISYQRTVGQDVTLSLSGAGIDQALVGKIAKELETAIGGSDLRVRLSEEGCVMTARVASRSRRATESVVTAFASALSARGIAAEARVTPRTERVTGNVYAAAAARVIELNIDGRGKTSTELEASIRSQLETAGIANPTVSVSKDGDKTTVQIHAEDGDGQTEHREMQLHVNLAGEGADSTHTLIIQPTAGATPDEIKSQIENELRARGIDGNVTVSSDSADGKRRVEVKVERHQ